MSITVKFKTKLRCGLCQHDYFVWVGEYECVQVQCPKCDNTNLQLIRGVRVKPKPE